MRDWNLALLQAAEKDDMPALSTALEQGADVNTRSKHGHSALFWAVLNANADVVAELLSRGAKADVKNAADYSALDWALGLEDKDNVKHLYDALKKQGRLTPRDGIRCESFLYNKHDRQQHRLSKQKHLRRYLRHRP